MKIKVLTFGSLTEFLDSEFSFEATSTDQLVTLLSRQHSELKDRKLLIAVNNVIVQKEVNLKENDTVALMPPYSGG